MKISVILLGCFAVIQLVTTSPSPTKDQDEVEALNAGKNPFPIKGEPCGPNAIRIIKFLTPNTTTSYCTCRRGGYFGDPNQGCVPECESGAECSGLKVCSRNECIDACPGFCGENMKCEIKDYRPICTCISGYHNVPGHPCVPIHQPLRGLVPYDPCEPNPCRGFAFCSRKTYNTFECTCMHKNGRSYPNCRAECSVDSDCPDQNVCDRNYCQASRSSGRPSTVSSPCQSDRCGPFTEKVVVDGRRVCKCLPGYYGIPPNCSPECNTDSDCPLQMSCYHKAKQCVDPCIGACHSNAICTVQNHTPVCVCSFNSALTGSDPFKTCYFNPSLPPPYYPTETPIPNYCEDAIGRCGPNAKCAQQRYAVNCTCLEGYSGSPPNCKRECDQNSECPKTKTCVNSKCINPCDEENACGVNADCKVVEHAVQCSCATGSKGDPQRACNYNDVCSATPSPCGDAACEVGNGAPCCSCNPTNGTLCAPECTLSAHCPLTMACIKYKCVDPCVGACGSNAICLVPNHVPFCLCPEGYTGDPFISCVHPSVTQ